MQGASETSDSDAKQAVLHAQNHRRGLEPIETFNSGPKVTILLALIHRRGLGHLETCNFGAKHAVLLAKAIDEVWTHRDY